MQTNNNAKDLKDLKNLKNLEDLDLNIMENENHFSELTKEKPLLNNKGFYPILDIFTIQMSKWRKLPDEIKLISTVAKDKHFFSPEWKIVDDSKNGRITPLEYEKYYFQSLINKLKKDKFSLIKSIQQDSENFNYSLAYSCYCPINKFCHRHLIIKFLKCYFDKYYQVQDQDLVKNKNDDNNYNVHDIINELKKDVKIDFIVHFKDEFEC